MRLGTFMNMIAETPKPKVLTSDPTTYQMTVCVNYENGYISAQEAIAKLMATGLTEVEARTLLFT